MTETRDQIHTYIADVPGIYFNELDRQLDIARGQLQYHLRHLQQNNRVTACDLYGYTHYFTPEYGAWEQRVLALCRRETTQDILAYLIVHGDARPATLSTELQLARSTVEWHLDHLVEQDIATRSRDAQNRVQIQLTRPEQTINLLQDAHPSLSQRMVDRFTRLVDSVLQP